MGFLRFYLVVRSHKKGICIGSFVFHSGTQPDQNRFGFEKPVE